MSQITCIACHKQIFRGERVLSAEFGTIIQSPKSQRDTIQGYAVDIVHFACIPVYMGHISGNEMSEAVRNHLRQEIRKEVVTDMREEIKAELYDEMLDEFGKTCQVCQGELDESVHEDSDPVVQSAAVVGQQPFQPPTPPALPQFQVPPISPFGPVFPPNFTK